jgi:glutamate---cysteine ligase / carboxylate-amine ligase
LPLFPNDSFLAEPAADVYLGAQALEQRLRALFDRVAPFTVGAEEELLLVDGETLQPAPAAEFALALGAGDKRLAGELRKAQVEAMTPVCVSVADVARELGSIRRLVANGIGPGVLVVGTGTHPLTREPGPISSAQRYRRIADEHPWAARNVLTCGMHVHVAVSGADRALAVYNALRGYLPELLALGANAPFYGGEDTGLASARAKLNESWPRAGVPPAFETWRELAAFAVWARDGGAFPDSSHQWWDLRLSAAHGTIEVRVADTQTRVDDAATLIALVQSLVYDLAARYDAGEPLPVHPHERIVENMWLATRDGIGGHLVDLETGARMWTAERLHELASRLLPTATTLGCDRELLGLGRLVLDGGGAARQRSLVKRRGLEALLPMLADRTSSLSVEEVEARVYGASMAAGSGDPA